ncbi:ABC transporter ATP-binding protein, partial [Coprobacillus cateniformis]|nr:ABC transporter ATP-binding protein [Coprobacillus cateniformis]
VIGVSNQLEIFNQLSIGFIIGLFIIAIIILKIFDQYQWRKQEVLLEVNGVSQKKMNNLLLKKELYLLFYPWIISIMIVSGIYWGLDLLDRDVIIHICLLITLAIFFIFIFSYFIYVLIRKAVSNINIIKKF